MTAATVPCQKLQLTSIFLVGTLARTSIVRFDRYGVSTVKMMAAAPRSVTFFSRASDADRSLLRYIWNMTFWPSVRAAMISSREHDALIEICPSALVFSLNTYSWRATLGGESVGGAFPTDLTVGIARRWDDLLPVRYRIDLRLSSS